MPDNFVYPTSAELRVIEQDKLPLLTLDDPIFEHFPIVNLDQFVVMWEQQDNYTGLQQLRGLNGDPAKVQRVGSNRYMNQGGVYGEFVTIDEQELTTRRKIGTFGESVDITDLVMSGQDHLLDRRYSRIREIIWTLLATGTFSVATALGVVAHQDSYTFQQLTAAVNWATAASATPLVDFRNVKLKARGHSIRFDNSAWAYMNQKEVNKLLNNTNASDLGGKRHAGGNTLNSLSEVNKIFLDNDLPQVVAYDEGYLDSTGTFVPFIPDERVVVIGRRTNGAALGEYQMIRNAQNADLGPGPYTKVIDRRDIEVSGSIIQVHDGHNGGPAIFYPSGVCVIDTTP